MIFVDVHVAETIQTDVELAAKLEELCPVDIFAAAANGIEVIEGNLDECILCGLCVQAAPPDTIEVVTLYGGGLRLANAESE